MKNIAKLSENELKELFQATSAKIKLREEIVEKDFWVCFLLDHLFNDSVFRDFFVFKGSGSLTLSPLRLVKGENPVPMQEGGACCGGSVTLLPRCHSLLCLVTALCFASLLLSALPRYR